MKLVTPKPRAVEMSREEQKAFYLMPPVGSIGKEQWMGYVMDVVDVHGVPLGSLVFVPRISAEDMDG